MENGKYEPEFDCVIDTKTGEKFFILAYLSKSDLYDAIEQDADEKDKPGLKKWVDKLSDGDVYNIRKRITDFLANYYPTDLIQFIIDEKRND